MYPKGKGKRTPARAESPASRRRRPRDSLFPGLHASHMPRPLEHGRSHLGLSLPRLAFPRDGSRAQWACRGPAGATRPSCAAGMTGRICTLRPPTARGLHALTPRCAEGVSRHHSLFVAPQAWLRRGAAPQPESTEGRAARQRLHPAGRACDRRVGGARAPACSQNERVPIILREAACAGASGTCLAPPSRQPPTFFVSPSKEAPPWRCLL
jgi:hypothetical protein